MDESTTTLVLVLGGACVVGYLVVSKLIDFLMRDGSDDDPPSWDDGGDGDDGMIGGHDPNKPIG